MSSPALSWSGFVEELVECHRSMELGIWRPPKLMLEVGGDAILLVITWGMGTIPPCLRSCG